MHVAMRAVPEHRLVVERVEAYSTLGRRSDAAQDVRQPGCRPTLIDRCGCIRRIVAGYGGRIPCPTVGVHHPTVARIRIPGNVRSTLISISRDRKSPIQCRGRVGRLLRCPPDNRHREEDIARGRSRHVDEIIRSRAVGKCRRIDGRLGVVLEIPIACDVRHIRHPVVAGRGIASPPPHRPPAAGDVGVVAERDAVDQRRDGVAVQRGVDGNGDVGRPQERWSQRQGEER
jgi:hypothetical protein